MKEVWKFVVGNRNYKVSNLGRVISLPRVMVRSNGRDIKINGKMLNPCVREKGYLSVGIGNKSFLVHRLVGLAFIPNPHHKPQINHKDFNTSNCRVDNLEWVTNRENSLYSTERGRFGLRGRRGWDNPVGKRVRAVNISTGKEMLFGSQKDAARKLGLTVSNVCRVSNGKRSSVGNFKFNIL